MMKIQHKELHKRWQKLSLFEQMANIGSEVERALSWQEKGNREYSILAFERALELLDFTIEGERKFHRLKELTRAREVLVDYFTQDNYYRSSPESWRSYFLAYNYAARLSVG